LREQHYFDVYMLRKEGSTMEADARRSGIGMAPSPSSRVYYPSDAELYIEGNIPLYLNWIVEGADGHLYVVPAEAGGWWKRHQYGGLNEKLETVTPEKARTIIQFVCGSQGDLSRDRYGKPAGRATQQPTLTVRLEDGEYATGILGREYDGNGYV